MSSSYLDHRPSPVRAADRILVIEVGHIAEAGNHRELLRVDGQYRQLCLKQFNPDLLPSDVTGSEIYREQDGSFEFQPGPIFGNLVLADEINRAPAKVQAALLEAMEERQTTVAGKTHKLPDLFLVLATQNPIEQQGTYPLPEAQMDRFLIYVKVPYPPADNELSILRLVRSEKTETNGKSPERIPQESIFEARKQVNAMHIAESVEQYIVDLVITTRQPDRYGDELARLINVGASPRATIAIAVHGRRPC